MDATTKFWEVSFEISIKIAPISSGTSSSEASPTFDHANASFSVFLTV